MKARVMTECKRAGGIALAILLCVSGPAHGQEAAAPEGRLSPEQVQSVIQGSRQSIRDILGREVYLPGLAVALVSRDEVLWAEGFGFRDAEHRGRVDADTMFGILSVSKTVTVTGLMIAVQEGLLRLDVPIKTYLPEFRLQSRSGEDPMSVITLRHLLSMTSGLTHDAPVGNNADPFTPSYADHIRSISRTWLRFKTGERAEYSNLGVELAAYILETVIRKPFTEYVRENVFDPLGMTRSTYDMDRIRADENRAVGNNKAFERVPLDNPMPAPGGVYASISDMARFLRFHLNRGRQDGKPLLEEKWLSFMQTIPFPMKDQARGYGMGLWPGYYHLGGRDVRTLEHGGGGFGFRCQMKWLPDLGYGVMVMTNAQDHDNVNEDLVEEILLKIVERLTGKKDLGPADWLARHMPPRTVDAAYLPADLEGRYNGTNDDKIFLIKDGRFGVVSGTAFVPLTPVSPDEYASASYLYRFRRDAGGKPVSVVRAYDGTVWVLGSGKGESRGPDKKEWQDYLGSYIRKRFGVGEKFYTVSTKNGWLHFEGSGQDFLLTEHLPGLFFTPDGEAVDFRGPTPTFRNIKLYKARDTAPEVRVTYVGNAGFLIAVGGKKILIDALFVGFPGGYALPEGIRDMMAEGRPPFDGIDLALATHSHGDHFDPGQVRRFLAGHPAAVFGSTPQAVASLDGFPGRVIAFQPGKDRPAVADVRGIRVEAIPLSHGAPPAGRAEIVNYGYLVSVDGITLFHSGDIDAGSIGFEAFRALRLPEKKIDAAFVQHFYLSDVPADRRLVREGLAARYVVPSHYHYTEPPLDRETVLKNYPDAIVFAGELQSWAMPRPR